MDKSDERYSIRLWVCYTISIEKEMGNGRTAGEPEEPQTRSQEESQGVRIAGQIKSSNYNEHEFKTSKEIS